MCPSFRVPISAKNNPLCSAICLFAIAELPVWHGIVLLKVFSLREVDLLHSCDHCFVLLVNVYYGRGICLHSHVAWCSLAYATCCSDVLALQISVQLWPYTWLPKLSPTPRRILFVNNLLSIPQMLKQKCLTMNTCTGRTLTMSSCSRSGPHPPEVRRFQRSARVLHVRPYSST